MAVTRARPVQPKQSWSRPRWLPPPSELEGPSHTRRMRCHLIDLCLNSDRPANTAIRPCLLIRLRHASVVMNARSAQRASKKFCSTFVRTVEEALLRDQFGQPQTGRAIIILGKTRRVARSRLNNLDLENNELSSFNLPSTL